METRESWHIKMLPLVSFVWALLWHKNLSRVCLSDPVCLRSLVFVKNCPTLLQLPRYLSYEHGNWLLVTCLGFFPFLLFFVCMSWFWPLWDGWALLVSMSAACPGSGCFCDTLMSLWAIPPLMDPYLLVGIATYVRIAYHFILFTIFGNLSLIFWAVSCSGPHGSFDLLG